MTSGGFLSEFLSYVNKKEATSASAELGNRKEGFVSEKKKDTMKPNSTRFKDAKIQKERKLKSRSSGGKIVTGKSRGVSSSSLLIAQRPKRRLIQKNLTETAGLSWREETNLTKALYASLQDKSRSPQDDADDPLTEEFERRSKRNSLSYEGETPQKPINIDESSRDSNSSLSKAKVHAQRKFAQGQSAPNSPSATPVKFHTEVSQHEKANEVPAKIRKKMGSAQKNQRREKTPVESVKPSTENFLTFLCFRGYGTLPDHFGTFETPDKNSDTRPDTPLSYSDSDNGSKPWKKIQSGLKRKYSRDKNYNAVFRKPITLKKETVCRNLLNGGVDMKKFNWSPYSAKCMIVNTEIKHTSKPASRVSKNRSQYTKKHEQNAVKKAIKAGMKKFCWKGRKSSKEELGHGFVKRDRRISNGDQSDTDCYPYPGRAVSRFHDIQSFLDSVPSPKMKPYLPYQYQCTAYTQRQPVGLPMDEYNLVSLPPPIVRSVPNLPTFHKDSPPPTIVDSVPNRPSCHKDSSLSIPTYQPCSTSDLNNDLISNLPMFNEDLSSNLSTFHDEFTSFLPTCQDSSQNPTFNDDLTIPDFLSYPQLEMSDLFDYTYFNSTVKLDDPSPHCNAAYDLGFMKSGIDN